MNYADFMAANYDVVNALRQLGLNQYEAKAYFALASFGEHTAGELAERAELPRPRVYDVLTKLQDRGFVLIQQGRPVKYAALPIAEALKTLKKQRQNELAEELAKIDELGKELTSKIKVQAKSDAATGEHVWTLRGREAIYSKIAAMIAAAKKDIMIASTAEGLAHKLRAHEREIDKARSRGVRIHLVSDKAALAAVEAAKIAHSVRESALPTRLVVADDQALLFLTDAKTKPDDEVGIWLHSPHFAQTLKQTAGIHK
ncbi:MAG: helix-turn-helix domain-containing protein [Candidatus Norongarragalinales archaeon]